MQKKRYGLMFFVPLRDKKQDFHRNFATEYFRENTLHC